MKKLILALLVSTSFVSSAVADEVLTQAVDQVATVFVYTSECKPSDEFKKNLVSVAKLFMDAAGVDLTNRQFLSMVVIKTTQFKDVAKANPGFCQLMTEAYGKGKSER